VRHPTLEKIPKNYLFRKSSELLIGADTYQIAGHSPAPACDTQQGNSTVAALEGSPVLIFISKRLGTAA
jgi:hypothetical protein